MAIEPVQVKEQYSHLKKKYIQVSRLQQDGLLLLDEDPEVWIQTNPDVHLSVRLLELSLHWGVEKIGDSIGTLAHLTHLFIFDGNFKCLPNSISSLSNLKRLQLSYCSQLQQLPPNLGDLRSLIFLSLTYCPSIKSLPDSIANLSNSTSLHLTSCHFLKELPTHLNILKLKIEFCCSIQSLPEGLGNLKQLQLSLCSIQTLANLMYLRSLCHLTLNNHCSCEPFLQELPANLGELSKLLTLNIQDTHIKWLPWSIAKLSKLRLLSLPEYFKLETLPRQLKDSIVISVKDTHIRKTWKELKTEIKLCSIPGVGEMVMEATHSPSTPAYLQFRVTSLHLTSYHYLKELPIDLNNLELKIEFCCNIQSLPKGLGNPEQLQLSPCSIQMLAILMYLRSLCHLTLNNHFSCEHFLEELPLNLGELSELLTVNIQDTYIKWLPWSITELSKLRLLSLPEYFRLETPPRQLNDSVVSSVEDTHICKTRQELKTETKQCSISGVGEMVVEATHSPSTSGYLQYGTDPGPWNQSTSLHSSLQILGLESRDHELDRNILNPIWKPPEFLHLYISDINLNNLPLMLKMLTHLSLFRCDFESCCDSLLNLSTLQSLALLQCRNLPALMDLPVSLTHFALELYIFDLNRCNYIASIRKLSNLKTLNLSQFEDLELSQLELNLAKLKIDNCTIRSLPKCLQHLEIIHSKYWCGNRCSKLQKYLNDLVNIETLSVTCYGLDKIEFLPTIARHQTLQELQLKDCFSLKNLPRNLDELVKLRTLNVSGTRIKSLPDSITKLQNLQKLILPKCFIRKGLPKNFKDQVRVSIDDTDDIYYQHAGYYDSCYNSCEDNEIMSEYMEGGDEVISQEVRHESFIKQASSHSVLKALPDSTQVHEGSPFSSRTFPIDNAYSSSQNLEMEMLLTVNKDCGVPLAPHTQSDNYEISGHYFVSNIRQVHSDLEELEDFPISGRIYSVGENSNNALCNLQNQEVGISPSRNKDCAGNFPDDLASTSSYNLHDTNRSGERNQQVFQNDNMDINILEIEQRNPPCDSINFVQDGISNYSLGDGQDKNHQSVDVKHKNSLKINVPEERIQEKLSEGKTLELAAEELGISRSTLKRRLKELKRTWPAKKQRKQRQVATKKKEKHSTELLSERNSSQPSLVDPNTSTGHDHGAEHIAGTGSFSTFDVKATYNGDIVRIDNFSLSSSIEQLKEEVGKKHELEVGKFKMKYLDTDEEWIKFTAVSELAHALYSSDTSGKSVIRLLITSET